MSVKKKAKESDSIFIRDEITNQDLSEFAQAYLKALLFHNSVPNSLLLPMTPQKQTEDQLQNIYALLNQVISSDISPFQQKEQESYLKTVIKTTKGSIFDEINEQQRLPSMYQQQVNKSAVSEMSLINNLIIEEEEEIVLPDVNEERQYCWG